MSEEEVNYASVVFKNKKHPPPEAIKEEEIVYDEVKVRGETPGQTSDSNAGFLPDKKANKRRRHYQQLACCLGTLCVILLLGIIALCVLHRDLLKSSEKLENLKSDRQEITFKSSNDKNKIDKPKLHYHYDKEANFHFAVPTLSHESDVRELNQLKENQTALLDANRHLTNNNSKLSSDNENLRRDHKNLNDQFDNLTKGYTVLERKTTNLTAKIQQLNTSNQELETQRNNLTAQIRDMETNWNELNVSRAQWSIDAYCNKTNNVRECKICQKDWLHKNPTNPSCHAINNAKPADRRTWEGAREDCKGKNADLAVIHNEGEKNVINGYSWGSRGTAGYWIGLRVEDGKWKWIDGTDLTESYWARPPPPPTDGHCAISFEKEGWKSVSCDERQQWICKKNALSL